MTPQPRPRVRIPRAQWDLPAGIRRCTTKVATLREVMDPSVDTVAFHELSRGRQVELAIRRIRRQRRYRLLMFVTGAAITKRRAIEALRARSPLGRALLAVEGRLLASLHEEAPRRSAKRRSGR
jgi:hypothetical protein